MNKTYRLGILVLLSSIAVTNITVGCYRAFDTNRCTDLALRWLDAKLILHHENPYQMNLSGNPSIYAKNLLNSDEQLQRAQLTSTSLPSSYCIIFPYALLPFMPAKICWLATNLIAAGVMIFVSFMLHKERGGKLFQFTIVALISLCSIPLATNLWLGQTAVVALSLLLSALYFADKKRPYLAVICLILAMVKYVLIIPFLIAFIFVSEKRWLVWVCAVVHIMLHCVICSWINTSPIKILFDVASIDCHPGLTQVGVNLVLTRLKLPPQIIVYMNVLLMLIFISSLLFVKPRRKLDWLALTSMVSMAITYHRSYDFVCYFFCCLWLMSLRGFRVVRVVGSVPIIYLFFGRFLHLVPWHLHFWWERFEPYLVLGNTYALAIIGLYIFFQIPKIRTAERETRS